MKVFDPLELQHRMSVARWVLAGAFLILGGAFFKVQVLQHEKYQLKAETNRLRPVPLTPPRGTILDRNVRTSQDLVGALRGRTCHIRKGFFGDQDQAVVAIDAGLDIVGAGATALQEVGLRGPARAAGVAPVGGLDQRNQGIGIGVHGPSELQARGGGHASTGRK